MCVRAFISLVLVSAVIAGTSDQWRSRTIYQLLTDRFARTDGSTAGCSNIKNYCGGSFQGIVDHLSYIQGMGFDAIWISPIPENYPGGFHGYWQTNLYNINSNFGSSQDLLNLVKAAHQLGMWVMLDVVGNHVGPVGYDYSGIYPFNSSTHYHDCSPCPAGCSISDWNNQPQVEWCRLAGLPDLDQSNAFVNSTLVSWIVETIATYGFDGIRIDTVPEVPMPFWAQYVGAAGVYAVGEVFNGNIPYVASYQYPKGPMSGLLSYPMFFTMRSVFGQQQSMNQLESENQAYTSGFSDLGLMGTFLDNHDNARFLNVNPDHTLYKNGLAYTLLSVGIPIIYYGTEQGFNGGNDPDNREVLWTTAFATNTDLYQFLQTVITVRKKYQVWNSTQVQRYSDNSFYAFTRGNLFLATTNVGSNGSPQTRPITYHPYADNTKLCNWLDNTDCVVVTNKQFNVQLVNGMPKIYVPSS
eukprot:TRINITY_DN4198_c0_g1_i1.p1 TRINITY_DN4198_c0_g1~~TRINITY_DN4198_c0_g1_i1.p1  ORF type:complete len:468 (-),score=96.29 TRINITY_DN4198_c0_g1_i1:172-1575(-)